MVANYLLVKQNYFPVKNNFFLSKIKFNFKKGGNVEVKSGHVEVKIIVFWTARSLKNRFFLLILIVFFVNINRSQIPADAEWSML